MGGRGEHAIGERGAPEELIDARRPIQPDLEGVALVGDANLEGAVLARQPHRYAVQGGIRVPLEDSKQATQRLAGQGAAWMHDQQCLGLGVRPAHDHIGVRERALEDLDPPGAVHHLAVHGESAVLAPKSVAERHGVGLGGLGERLPLLDHGLGARDRGRHHVDAGVAR